MASRKWYTQGSPKVKIFGQAPLGSEPTGITFTPDYKYLFMSIMHPTDTNNANQTDAEGNLVLFDKGTSIVMSLAENLGVPLSVSEFELNPNKIYAYPNPIGINREIVIKKNHIKNIKLFTIQGKLLVDKFYNNVDEASLQLDKVTPGLYLLKVNNQQSLKVLIR